MEHVPTVDQLGKTTDLVSDKPVAFVAAFFALAFLSLLVWHLRTSAKMQAEHSETLLKLAIRFEHLSTKTYEVMADCRDALGRKRGPRKARPEVDPLQVTAVIDPKEVARAEDSEAEG